MRDIMIDTNTAHIMDGRSGDTHTIYYRNPAPDEIAAYRAACFVRRGKKIINNQFAARLRFGRRIITGFKKGTLSADGHALSDAPGDPGYRPNWLDLLCQHAPDIVEAVAALAFEGTVVAGEELESADLEDETILSPDGQDDADPGGGDADMDPFGMPKKIHPVILRKQSKNS